MIFWVAALESYWLVWPIISSLIVSLSVISIRMARIVLCVNVSDEYRSLILVGVMLVIFTMETCVCVWLGR